jgi:hypothetical protein
MSNHPADFKARFLEARKDTARIIRHMRNDPRAKAMRRGVVNRQMWHIIYGHDEQWWKIYMPGGCMGDD